MRTAAANLARVMIRPRATLRRILDAGRDRMILPLVALAAISGFLGDFNPEGIERVVAGRVPFPLAVAGLILVSIAIAVLFFYLIAWAAFGIGKLLEGAGSARDVRSGVAWGLAPIVWALLYRLPAAIFWPQQVPQQVKVGAGRLTFDPNRFGSSCLAAAVVGLLELAMVIWCISVASNTIGEAHRFSSWRGLATIVLVGISPALIAIAAALAM